MHEIQIKYGIYIYFFKLKNKVYNHLPTSFKNCLKAAQYLVSFSLIVCLKEGKEKNSARGNARAGAQTWSCKCETKGYKKRGIGPVFCGASQSVGMNGVIPTSKPETRHIHNEGLGQTQF